jgi:hypothetical protein
MCEHILEENLMKSVTVLLLCVFSAGMILAQPSVVSTVPADGATSVSASTTLVSITFDQAVDTTQFAVQGKGNANCILANFDSLTAVSFSADHKTVNLAVKLSANKPYFAAIYSVKSASQVPMTAPYGFNFTTAASFPTTTVSGTVLSGSSGVGTAGAFVALSTVPITAGDPIFVAGTIADIAGNFTVEYVPNGTLYPLAAKDVNGDGSIDPSTGDVVGTGNEIVVSGSNLNGVTITFLSTLPYRFKDALDTLNLYLASLPSPRTLRVVQGSSIDSTGRGSYWEFDYTGTNLQSSFQFRVQTFGAQIRPMDSLQYQWVVQSDPIVSFPATAVVDSFLARAERSGGYDYRPKPMSWNGFDVRLNMGNLTWQGYMDMISDTSKSYLGVTYWYGVQGEQQITYGQRRFVGDYTTGNILGTTAVSPTENGAAPSHYALSQNYPNPFNPATTIEFSLPTASSVQLRVYNMLGQEVATLVNGNLAAGAHRVSFDGSHLSSGVYLYRLSAGSYLNTMKMVLLK